MGYADAEMIVDFEADWFEILRRTLRREGYEPSDDDQGASFQYFNLEKRRIAARARKVHEAITLACPPELQTAYENLKAKIVSGEELRPHLSRRLTDLDFDDMLINDWGIHHLHLGAVVEADGLVARTGPVLFARFEDDDAYLITIQGHGPGKPTPWANQEMLQTLHENWPTILEPFFLRGVLPGERLTDDQILVARRGGVQTLICLGERTLSPPGGGYSTAGIAIRVVTESDRHRRMMREWEAGFVKLKATAIMPPLQEYGVPLPARLTLDFDEHLQAHAWAPRPDGGRVLFALGVSLRGPS